MTKTSSDTGLHKPFWVVTTDTGNFHSGYNTQRQAEGEADRANEEAEDLGLRTRYEAVPKPERAPRSYMND